VKVRFVIPYPSTKAGKSQWTKEYGLNAYYAGKHWSKRKRDAEFWHSLVRSELRKQLKPRLFKEPVIVSFWWNDRLDIDNHAAMGKMIVDAMKGILIEDDTRRYVHGVGHLFHDEDCILVEVAEDK
jgi:hypothetical protein